MITNAMSLITKKDARQWASDLGVEGDAAVELVAEWIWSNKNDYNCTIQDHPISNLSAEDLWNIAYPEEA